MVMRLLTVLTNAPSVKTMIGTDTANTNQTIGVTVLLGTSDD